MDGRTTVRMTTVAEIANVSQSAVSKVLNGRPGVSAELRRRVMDAVEATGYQWHRRAPRHGSVEVVFGSVGSALNAPLLRGFSAVLRAAGRPLTVSHADGAPDWLEHLLAHRPAGAVLVLSPVPPDVRRRLAEARLPTVVLDTIGDAPAEMNAVGATQWRGGALAAHHLTGLGHRRIALITGPLDLVCCRARFGGYLSALREANIRPDRALIRSVRFQAEPARRAAHTLLDSDSAPTSFVTGNDLQALGVIEACTERGLRVPEDVSVVGFDDIDAARSSAPALTTVRQPFEDMAAESIRVLGSVSDDPSLPPVRLDMSVDLVVRKSTGPAAKDDGRRLFPLLDGS
ncbi:LacI family transcriptional regulator (plasmid) [Streptomyces sp. NBC_01450]|uniref:LacI family DNA-binding transcriptional regulator n=1 Tax=Streptomyces sp. NBC_01450 TaxID=2903871 RepID=UPI002E331055|nr:LacI family DNA-binding transcriptional regulator [Streptomyces sp. NBC_01450]